MLEIRDLHVRYGAIAAVRGVDLDIKSGEIVALIGANGAGKSTIARAVAGLLPFQGEIRYEGRALKPNSAEQNLRAGIALVPEGRHLFPRLTVDENLLLGAHRSDARRRIAQSLELCFETFPALAERRRQIAGSMSGGEQQMLALARALMTAPRILLVDEPSVGLSPLLVGQVITKIEELKRRFGLTVLMAEQNLAQAIRIADRGYVIVHGRIEFEGTSREELANNELVKRLYLGL